MRRLVVVAVFVALLSAVLPPGPALAQTGPTKLQDLWRQYPLDEGGTPPRAAAKPSTTTPAEPDSAAVRAPAARDPGSSNGPEWIPPVALLAALLILIAAILDHLRGRRAASLRTARPPGHEPFGPAEPRPDLQPRRQGRWPWLRFRGHGR